MTLSLIFGEAKITLEYLKYSLKFWGSFLRSNYLHFFS